MCASLYEPHVQKTYLPSGHTTLKWRRINVDATWSRRIDVDTTSFWCCVPAGNSFWHALPTKTEISLCSHAVFMKKLCILGYLKCDQRRFWSDCANLRWALMYERTFPDVAAQVFCVDSVINKEGPKWTKELCVTKTVRFNGDVGAYSAWYMPTSSSF